MFGFNKQPQPRLTNSQLMARLKFIVGVALTITLLGIVFSVLYSLIFVPQPLDAISPIDTKFFELIIPIATFLSGTLSGIMLGSNKEKDDEEEEEGSKPCPDQEYVPPSDEPEDYPRH
jgi:hypothetical protein